MQILFQDFRYALRQLRKNPGFAGTAILILGLGIGATTAIFSAVNPILFEPLPVPARRPDHDDLVCRGGRLPHPHELFIRIANWRSEAVPSKRSP